jgi:hypothetical protein
VHRPLRTVRPEQNPRRGSATVELAVMVPLFLTLLLGAVEMGSAISTTQKLHGALRDGGRLASMDYSGILAKDVDPNAKVKQDIRNFLTAEGIPGDKVTLKIVHAGGGLDGQTFDLTSKSNYLKLFRIEAAVPYSEVSTFPLKFMSGQTLTAQLTFRKGRVTLVAN